MAVDDYGIEVLKKAGNELTNGDKSDYYLATKGILDQLQVFDPFATPILDYDSYTITENITAKTRAITFFLGTLLQYTVNITQTGASIVENQILLLDSGDALLLDSGDFMEFE